MSVKLEEVQTSPEDIPSTIPPEKTGNVHEKDLEEDTIENIEGSKQKINLEEKPKFQDNPLKYRNKPSKPFKSIIDIGFSETQNTRWRRTMEDGHCMIDGFREKQEGFFAIYDGHGGKEAMEYTQENFHKHFEQSLSKSSSIKESFENAYQKTDQELKNSEIHFSGTTIISCLLLSEKVNNKMVRKLYTANAGDARVVLKSGKKITRLTYDHKTTDDGEAKRIKDKGGFVINKRVNGILSVTRALGDHAMKEWVTSEPYFSEVIIEEDNNCLILACDGIWDVINDEEVFEYIKDLEDAQEMSDFLLEKSIKLGSTDNISVMVVIF